MHVTVSSSSLNDDADDVSIRGTVTTVSEDPPIDQINSFENQSLYGIFIQK